MQPVDVTTSKKRVLKPKFQEGEKAYRLDLAMAAELNPGNTLVMSGFWRSGTTWIQEALREILAAKTLFEPLSPLVPEAKVIHAHHHVAGKSFEFLRMFIPYCGSDNLNGQPLHELFYKSLRSELEGAWVRRFRQGLEESRRSRLVVKFVRAQLCLRAAQNTFAMPVLHVYRDPRAVMASIRKTKWHWLFDHLSLREQLLEIPDGRAEYFDQWRDEILRYDQQDPVSRVVAYWAMTEKFLQQSYAGYQGRVVFISYEKLAQGREKVFADVLKQLHVPPAHENFRVPEADSTTTSQAQRGASVGERVAGWKKFLSSSEIAATESITQYFGLEDRLVGGD